MWLWKQPPQLHHNLQQTANTSPQQNRLLLQPIPPNLTTTPLNTILQQKRIEITMQHDRHQVIVLQMAQQFCDFSATACRPTFCRDLGLIPRFVDVKLFYVFRVH